MKRILTNFDVTRFLSSNRRGFLKGAGTVAAASAALPLAGRARIAGPKVRLLAEGAVGLNAVVPTPDLSVFPPEVLQQIALGALQIRQRLTFPSGEDDDTLSIQVFIVPSAAPLPLPTPPPVPPSACDPITVSLFEVEILRVVLSDDLTPNLSLLGRVISAPVPSPFGEIVGRVAAFGAGYDQAGEVTNFVMLGGFVAGSHSTWSLTGKGALAIGRR